MISGLVKWDDRSRNSRGEDGILDQEGGQRDLRERTDAELRKHRDQKGLETPVDYAVNHVHSLLSRAPVRFSKRANALNVPPGEYSRKAETQRTSRALNRPVEHAI